MRAAFSRTLSFLDSEGRHRTGALSASVLVLVAIWVAWLTFSRTTVYATSDQGRLLAAGAASPVQTPVAGIVAENRLKLGAEVLAGDVLLRLDASAEELRKKEELTRIAGVEEIIENLNLILEAERGLARANVRVAETRVGSAAARARAADDIAVLTRQQDEAVQKLKNSQLASGLEALKAAENMQRERAQVVASHTESSLARADLLKSSREAEVRLLTLQRELVELHARVAASRAVVAQLDWELARRTLRAPIGGIVADISALPEGSGIGVNQVVASVVPQAKMQWVAHFSPREAVGRIRPGQKARIRLDAFPWTAYGALTGVVVRAGSEPREQRVRVELDVTSDSNSVPLVHGMTGVADIEVEELSPLRLLLRLAGQIVQNAPVPTERAAPMTSSGPP
jgi:multidrug resistance efflux pump